MDSNQRAATGRMYEDMKPDIEWAPETHYDTLLVYLPGFVKEQLKLYVNTNGKLLIKGERLEERGANKGVRVNQEHSISTDSYDSDRITAQFDNGILYIKLPKLNIAPPQTQQQQQQQDKQSPPPLPPQPQKRDVRDGTSRRETASLTDDKSMQTEGKSGESMGARNEISEREEAGAAHGVSGKTPEAGEKSKDVAAAGDGKKTRETSDKRVNGDSNGGLMATAAAKKLGVSVNWVLVVLVALMLGFYVTNWIRSGKKYQS